MSVVAPISHDCRFEYIPCFDGLRCIAASIVVAAHLHLVNFIPGGFGVSVFFVISGVLITRLLVAEHIKVGKINLPAFYVRRVIRLSPALYAMVAITFAVFIYFKGHIDPLQYLSALFYFNNYYRLARWYEFGSNDADSTIWGITWSLSIEEHFYLMFPALLILLGPTSRRVFYVLSALVFIPLFLRIFYWFNISSPEMYNYFATETRLDSILTGCCLAIYMHHFPTGIIARIIGKPWVLWLALIGIVSSLLYRDPLFQECIRYSIEQFLLLIVIYQLAYTPNHQWIKGILESTPFKIGGRLSYSVYLWHGYINGFVVWLFNKEIDATTAIPAVVITIIVSAISYYCLEMPLVNLRRKYGSNSKHTP